MLPSLALLPASASLSAFPAAAAALGLAAALAFAFGLRLRRESHRMIHSDGIGGGRHLGLLLLYPVPALVLIAHPLVGFVGSRTAVSTIDHSAALVAAENRGTGLIASRDSSCSIRRRGSFVEIPQDRVCNISTP